MHQVSQPNHQEPQSVNQNYRAPMKQPTKASNTKQHRHHQAQEVSLSTEASQDHLKVVSWNCKGYPWRRGPEVGPIAEGNDVIILVETHEHDGCKVPNFEGYKKFSLWNKGNEKGKRYGGVTVLIHEKWYGIIKFEKEDSNKQYIWLQITMNEITFRVAACYFAPQNSKIYKRRKLDREDPYASLKMDISVFSTTGDIMLVGDFNARTTNNQSLQLLNSGKR